MSVWKRIGRELRWFFIALMCSALLAFLFLQLQGMVRSEESASTVFSLGRYAVAVVVMPTRTAAVLADLGAEVLVEIQRAQEHLEP